MKKLALILAFLIGGIASSFAACTSPAVMHDFPGTSFNMSLATVPDGNCGSNVALPTWAGGTLGAMANYGTSPGAVLVPGVNAFITNTPTVSVPTWAGGTLGAMANYGTSPGAVLVPGVNAFITNTNANGQAALASSSPVAVAKNSGTGSTVAGAAVGSAGTASAEVVTIQGVTSMTPVQVSQATASNLNAAVVGTGTAGSAAGGVLTVQGVASMTPFLSNPGTAANWGVGATGSAVPANAVYAGVLDASGGANLLGLAGDPCQTSVKTTVPVTLATAAVKVIVTGVSAKKIYVCAYELTNNAADSIAVFEATTGTTCATSAVAVVGAGTSVATAATGYNFAANGGISRGTGGFQVLQTATNANDLCIAQSAATQLSGSITYVTR